MTMRRSPFGVLLFVGIGLLLGAALFGGTAAVGNVLAAPLVALGFLFKIVLFFLLFSLIARLFAGSPRRTQNWSAPRRESWCGGNRSKWSGHPSEDEGKDRANDRFEEWHRMAHARQEVDDHTPPFEE
jgi:hypothetical protein